MKNNDKRIIYIYIFPTIRFTIFSFASTTKTQHVSFFAAIGIKYRDTVSLNGKIVEIYTKKKKKREKNAITIFPTVRFIISHSGRDKSPRKKEKEKKNPSKIVNRIPIFTFSRKLNTYSRGIDLYREMDS